MAFATTDLLLTANKTTQLTAALANLGVADPLQYLCDEAAAEVSRYTTGYVIADEAIRNFVRALALYRAYSYAGTVPKDVQTNYDAAMKELTAIAEGKRPNLPRVETDNTSPSTGGWGSETKLTT